MIDFHAHMHLFDYSETKEILSNPNCPDIIVNSVYNNAQLEYGIQLKNQNSDRFLISSGIHPQIADITDENLKFFKKIEENIKQICAIGEVGYDLYETNPPFESQRKIFRKEIEIAENYSLPLIIHCRNAFEQILEDLKKTNVPVIFHGYSGGFKYLNDILKRNYYISFGTPLTYEQSKNLKRIAEQTLSRQILTETDSPFNLKRHADYQIQKNKPYNLKNIISVLAEIKQISQNEIEAAIFENYREIFKHLSFI